MKKIHILVFTVIAFFILLVYLQWGQEVEGCNTSIETFNDGYLEHVSITSNSICIFDKEDFAKQVIQKITDNSLKDIKLSYDILGYPNGLHITVYMNNSLYNNGKSQFEISYLQNSEYGFQYNIKDNPEKFTLEIITQ